MMSMLVISTTAALAQTSTAFPEQSAPPPTMSHGMSGLPVQRKLPPLDHEQTTIDWPVADYFDQALQMTNMRPTARVSELKFVIPADARPVYVALPVQSQAFGYSPTFRAMVGAALDLQLEVAGVDATKQTEIADTHGPFVRRLPTASLAAFAAENPGRKLIELYVGHDGISQTFVTLVLSNGPTRVKSHRTLPFLLDWEPALAQITGATAGMLKEVGLPVRSSKSPTPREAGGCEHSTWALVPPSRDTWPGVRACYAIAVGTLLPFFEAPSWQIETTEQQSPARLAWIAQAYSFAGTKSLSPTSAAAIRSLALRQLGLSSPTNPATDILVGNDPIVDRILQFNSLEANSARAPVRSARHTREIQLARLTSDLPPFASAIFRARLDFNEALVQLDLCPIERLLPQGWPGASCSVGGIKVQSRAVLPAEGLLYQEWRLAAYYKQLVYLGLIQGSRHRTAEALAAWPADVTAHPYLQRLRHVIDGKFGLTGSFEDQLAWARRRASAITQNTVDLQRADRWLSGFSLNGHLWTSNTNLMYDDQVRKISEHEMRLLTVLSFDKFARDPYSAHRKSGDGAFFLGSTTEMQNATNGLPFLTFAGNTPHGLAPTASHAIAVPRRSVFPSALIKSAISDVELVSILQKNPNDLETRTSLAIGRLQDGGTLAEALKLIDAQPEDQRQDNRIDQSHAWANPAHYFYFAGELKPARRYYAKTAEIGTGSESDMMARTRLQLLDGNLRKALDLSTRRVLRYDSDYARRDQAALHFMFKEKERGWHIFLERAPSGQRFPLWFASYVGHRMDGMTPDRIDTWLSEAKLNQTQIEFVEVGQLYLHLYTVMDRLPEEIDIQRLKRRPQSKQFVSPLWGISANLVRSALMASNQNQAYEMANAVLLKSHHNVDFSFLKPLYTWAAWQATEGKDPYLEEVRAVTTRSSFDETLSKSMLLGLGNLCKTLTPG
jgi:hypothetical protein